MSFLHFLRDMFRYRPIASGGAIADLQPYVAALELTLEGIAQTREQVRQELITYLVDEAASELLYGTAYSDLWAPFEADMWSDA